MPRIRLSLAALLCALLAAPPLAPAADWFVAPSAAPGPATPGDGSRQKPFSDPWRALAAAASGDSIHIAQGTYFGRYDRSAWVVDRPRLTLLGGYSPDFARRDPWKNPTVFAFYRDYEGSSENNLLNGLDDHSGLTLDGLVLDGSGRNLYTAKPPITLIRSAVTAGPLLSFGSPDVTVRNCILINSSTGAAELRGEGSRFENNIVANHIGSPMLALRETNRSTKRPMIVRGNTFAFAHDQADPPMGKGGDKGVAIRAGAASQIENNAFIACGNAAIHLFAPPADVAIDRNLFSLPIRGNVAARIDGREMLITARNLDEMEDLGFKSSKNNRAGDADLAGLNPQWLEGVTRQILNSYATPPKDALAALRTKYSLPEPAKPANDDLGPIAPPLDVADACALRTSADAGAKPQDLPVQLAPPAAAAAAAAYAPVSWADFNAASPALDGRPVEFLAALGNERNGFVKRGISADTHFGFDIYSSAGAPDQIHVYSARNALAHRQWQDAAKSTSARDAEDWYLLRGVARLTGARQKATLEVHSITPATPPAKPLAARPQGRDWFIRAGASGGDGSRDKPFRDPFQALEKAADGDTLRIAAGDYFGKLRTAHWKINNKHLALLGGYDPAFAARDPWKNPTRLVMTPDAEPKDKSDHTGHFLQNSVIAEGLILDGLTFDGSTLNTYFDPASGGGLDIARSPFAALVQLQGPNITIRNCTFANASGFAVELSSAAGTFENNLVLNTSGTGLKINAMGPGPWIIRHNTFLFATDPTRRAGTGMSSAGTHVSLSGRAAMVIEHNLFAFADNQALRTTTPAAKLTLNHNTFAANLYCHLTDKNRVWLFDAVWTRRLPDAGYISAQNNTTALPTLPLDKQYADKVLPRLFDLKGRYTPEDWTRIAAATGASVTPPAPTTEPAPTPPPAAEKPKEQSLDDLMAELNKLKQDTTKPTTSTPPKGPPYAPAYPLPAALTLPSSNTTQTGARHHPTP